MKINLNKNGNDLIIELEGQLDTQSAPDLEAVIKDSLKGVKNLTFEFKKLNYLTSAGLRILLVSQKIMDKQGKMVIKNANEDIMDIFEMTGFTNILDIQN